MRGQRPPLPTLVAALVAACSLLPGVRLRGEEPLIQVDSAFVAQNDSDGWTVGNELIHYTLARKGSTVVVTDIHDMVLDRDWHRKDDPDSFVTVNGSRVTIGSSATSFRRAWADEWLGGARLNVAYRYQAAALDITRSYVVYPGSSVVETWTTFQATGSQTVALADMTNYVFTLDNGNLRWIRGAGVSDDEGGAFTIGSADLNDGQTFEIGSDRRSSETNLPWLSVSAWSSEGEQAQPEAWGQYTQLFGSILWSGSWRARVQRQAGSVTMQIGLPGFTTRLGAGGSLESPHAIFGTTNPSLPTASVASRAFIEHGVRLGRPLRALVTYNTAYSFGVFMDEASIRAEMELAAQMGFEQFVLDAGWWPEPNATDSGDFIHEWGSWQVDTDRFPSGLGALTDYAHQLGMRFGVWVEPERIDLATLGRDGLAKERFLATDNGYYQGGISNSEAVSGQICLADPEARQWVLDKLFEFLDDAHPDYLKWDNNFWINCNRATHGHGVEDGNFQHIRALRDVLQQLRDRYPGMDIEDCAGGGHRMSLDMLSFADVTWVDDFSSPSVRVRHDFEGLSLMFPPAYLSSFAMGGYGDPMDDEPTNDFTMLLRSRMLGIFGASSKLSDLSEGTRNRLSSEIGLYRSIRPIIQEAGSILLSRQVMASPDNGWPGWDAVEVVSPRSGNAVVFAFRSADAPTSALIKPQSLRPDAKYEVESADFGILGTVLGSSLAADGIQIDASGVSQSHVLIFRVQ
jgi:alpha-galactosidase